jgi:hypothetical protein
MSEGKNFMGQVDLTKEPMSTGFGQTAIEVAAIVWAVVVILYFYYSRGYVELIGQIGRQFFG